MRHANDRAFCHARQLIDVALNLGRVDVVAAADDQVFAAAHDRHIAGRVYATDIAGLEEAVSAELFCGFFWHAPIALEDVWPGHLNAANLIDRQGVPGFVDDPQSHTGQWPSHGATAALALACEIRVGREHDGLAHAVTLHNGVAGLALPLSKGF